eukprot:2505172-Rhodomonas_salina.1
MTYAHAEARAYAHAEAEAGAHACTQVDLEHQSLQELSPSLRLELLRLVCPRCTRACLYAARACAYTLHTVDQRSSCMGARFLLKRGGLVPAAQKHFSEREPVPYHTERGT